MSIKIYDGLIIKNANYQEIFNNMILLKNDLSEAISDKYVSFIENHFKSLKKEQEKNGFIDLNDYEDTFKSYLTLNQSKIETIYDFIYYYVSFHNRHKNKLSLDNEFNLLDSSICLFPNGNDILVLKYINFPEFDKILNKYLKLEDYSYYDNVDAPFEILKQNEDGYVSPEEWEQRKVDWSKLLLDNINSIPSQNSIQLTLEYDKITNFTNLLNKTNIKENYNIPIILKEKELSNQLDRF